MSSITEEGNRDNGAGATTKPKKGSDAGDESLADLLTFAKGKVVLTLVIQPSLRPSALARDPKTVSLTGQGSFSFTPTEPRQSLLRTSAAGKHNGAAQPRAPAPRSAMGRHAGALARVRRVGATGRLPQ